ncbi:MAG: sugar transferase [Bacillota bacterium]|nr:sugar transferase [Bacillota bacterium]
MDVNNAAHDELRDQIARWSAAFHSEDWSGRLPLESERWRRRLAYRCAKRGLDIASAALALLLLAPFFLVLALLIRRDSPGPVLFRQERVGRNLRPFAILKFRTMYHESTQSSRQLTVGSDRRITPSGHWLRRTKLDELPQLWNVLVGDMSLVGSRPEVPRYVACHPEAYRVLLLARPGITDRASLVLRDESALLGRVGADPAAAERYYRDELLPAKIWLSLEDRSEHAGFVHDLRLILETLGVLRIAP